MKCLVTGAAGFIGSHLCERLINDGHEVTGIDNLSGGRRSNLDSIINNPNFHFIRCDITSSDIYGAMIDIECVFHLAALADIVPSIENPTKYHTANVTGTVSILEAAKTHKVKRFLYAASSSCYGIPENYPTSECETCKPMYPYALTKYLGEKYVMHWAKVYKLPAISLRLFNVYGPRARTSGAYGSVFGTFLAQLANGAPLTVIGDGTQSRDFTYVTDVVEAFVTASKVHREWSGIMNICTGESQSVNHLVDLLGPATIEYLPKRPGEPDMTQGIYFLAAAMLGWKPKVSFEEGVAKMKELIPQYKDAPLWSKDKIEQATKAWFESLS